MAELQGASGKVRLREYETLFLVKSEVADEGVDRIKERLRAAVGRQGGKVLKFTLWGKRKTAFPVSRQPRATFVLMSYLGGSGVVAEVERNLAILEDVEKFLSKRLADNIDPETRAVEADVRIAEEEEKPQRPEREERSAESAVDIEETEPAEG